MNSRFRAAVWMAAIAAIVVPLVPAVAEPGSWLEMPKTSRVQPRDRTRNVEFLFGALKVAPDDTSAKAIEDRILALWTASSSDTTNILMSRVKTAIDAKDLDLAIKLLDSIVAFKPDYVEGWNRRATVHFMKKDYSSSIADIRQVLAREPRHFGAMAGLGMILNEIGNEKSALEVFRRALEIHPRLKQVPELVKTLKEKVEGRDI